VTGASWTQNLGGASSLDKELMSTAIGSRTREP